MDNSIVVYAPAALRQRRTLKTQKNKYTSYVDEFVLYVWGEAPQRIPGKVYSYNVELLIRVAL
jgi:hypothetical protein